MSSLSSASTLAQIKAAYLDNASYQEDADVAKARAFITACRMLLLKLPQHAAQGDGVEVTLDVRVIRDEMNAAKRWLANSAPGALGGGVRVASFQFFRDF